MQASFCSNDASAQEQEPGQRCFLSLKFSTLQQQQLHQLWPGERSLARWHRADLLHLTLVFLGLQTPQAQQQLWADCLKVLPLYPPIELRFDQFATFSKAKVLYLGLSNPPELLLQLQQQLLQLASPYLAAQAEPTFVPHLTLARHYQSSAAFPIAIDAVTLSCHQVALYHSLRTDQGLIYQPVNTYTLVKTN